MGRRGILRARLVAGCCAVALLGTACSDGGRGEGGLLGAATASPSTIGPTIAPTTTPGTPSASPSATGTPSGTATRGSGTGMETGAPSGTAGPPPSTPSGSPSRRYIFPVRSKAARYGSAHHDYPATDIFAPCGTRFVAPTDGVISEVSRRDTWSSRQNDGATRGGLSVSLVGVDGVRYYGSHLRAIAVGVRPGRRMTRGELLGRLGNTGSARGIACHLHFGLSPACGTGDWWVRRGVVRPYRFLTAWQDGRHTSPQPSVSTWRAEYGCPKRPSAPP
jgi:murein DD-endopeptidase MepM/ murein hydrolase activator NlpD